jgi:hypothetical protein
MDIPSIKAERNRNSNALLAAVVALGSTVTIAGPIAQSFPPQNAPCPTNTLAPYGGLAPVPSQCTTPNCLVRAYTDQITNKLPYQWWTSYQYYGPSGGYFYNQGLRTIFAPNHVSVDADGRLHLVANNDINLGGGFVWSGAEAVLMFNGDGSEANLGYGDYLVAVQLPAGPLNSLDPNMALGLFLYERPGTGATQNLNRELDLAEISSWGRRGANCPNTGTNCNKFNNSLLCYGSAQFALQNICQAPSPQLADGMVDRYDIGLNRQATLVLRWHGGNRPVTVEKYDGSHTFATLPPNPPVHAWTLEQNKTPAPLNFKATSPAALDNFIPFHTATSCERFHINFWFGNYAGGNGEINPPPSGRQEVIIDHFEFRPSTALSDGPGGDGDRDRGRGRGGR